MTNSKSLLPSIDRWRQLPFEVQMANIGTDVLRAIKWRNKGDKRWVGFYWQALDLLNLTKQVYINQASKLKELCRLYEVLVDYFSGDNIYKSSDKLWESYFNFFLGLAAKERE